MTFTVAQLLSHVQLFCNIIDCSPQGSSARGISQARIPGWVAISFSRGFSNKASEGDGIPVELFQILKDGAVKVLDSLCQQIWKTQQWPQDCKRSVFIPIPKKSNAKECSNYCTIVLNSHASKVMLKILQTRLQKYVKHELPDAQTGFRKGRGTRDQIANIRWIIKKANSRKTSTSALLSMPKPLTVQITTNCIKFFFFFSRQGLYWGFYCSKGKQKQVSLAGSLSGEGKVVPYMG